MIDVSKLENDLTAYFANVLDLQVDNGIYRGQIPATKETGVAVRITGKDETNAINHATFSVQVFGKFASRDDAWIMLSTLSNAMPRYGEQSENFIFVCLLKQDGASAPFLSNERGKVQQCASFNVRLCVLTNPA